MISNNALDGDMFGVSQFQQVKDDGGIGIEKKICFREDHLSLHREIQRFFIITPVIPNHRWSIGMAPWIIQEMELIPIVTYLIYIHIRSKINSHR